MGVFGRFLFRRKAAVTPEPAPPESLLVGARAVPLRLVRHPRARHYRLRLLPDGTIRLTVPRAGSAAAARKFAESQTPWLERQLQKLAEGLGQPARPAEWNVGSPVLLRGTPQTIEDAGPGLVRVGDELIRTAGATSLRPAIEKHLRGLAARELPGRVAELAREQNVTVSHVTVRNQKSRWGSCSRRGTVSLNWRLIQTPDFVRDYIILHELMHRRQMNHSAAFWREVDRACPDYPVAEAWLKRHAGMLRA